jgi:ABC-2 type transport system permease protein
VSTSGRVVLGAVTGAPAEHGTLRSARGLALRGIRNVRRLPSAFFPALAMPIFNMIAFSGTFYAVTRLPGFPTDRSINWYMPLGILMGSAFGGVGLGFSTIRDLESGFYDRLRMAPTSRTSLILGPLMSTWVRVLIMNLLVTALGVALGVRYTAGVWGVLALLAASLGLATVAAGWGLALAYRFRDMRGAAIMQLSVFVVMFLSTAQVPLDVMQGWLHAVARVNPATNILRLARGGLVDRADPDHLSWATAWGGLVALAVMAALTLGFAARSLQRLDD